MEKKKSALRSSVFRAYVSGSLNQPVAQTDEAKFVIARLGKPHIYVRAGEVCMAIDYIRQGNRSTHKNLFICNANESAHEVKECYEYVKAKFYNDEFYSTRKNVVAKPKSPVPLWFKVVAACLIAAWFVRWYLLN